MERESRPAIEPSGSLKQFTSCNPSLSGAGEAAQAATPMPGVTPEQAAACVGGVFVVVVHLFGDRHKRRVYLTLKAAEAAARRAEDRGQRAHVLLGRIEPIGHVGAAGTQIGGGL